MTDRPQPKAESQRRRLPPSERGRTQDIRRDELIIAAALELLSTNGYQALTMTDVASRAGVSKATLYRRWTTKADLVADAIDTLDPLDRPRYPGTSLRDDLLALMQQAGDCADRPDIVSATFDLARSSPDLYRTLSERLVSYMRVELGMLAGRAAQDEHAPLSIAQIDVIADTAVALLAHEGGPTTKSISPERMIRLVDEVLMVLITGSRDAAG